MVKTVLCLAVNTLEEERIKWYLLSLCLRCSSSLNAWIPSSMAQTIHNILRFKNAQFPKNIISFIIPNYRYCVSMLPSETQTWPRTSWFTTSIWPWTSWSLFWRNIGKTWDPSTLRARWDLLNVYINIYFVTINMMIKQKPEK